MEEGWRRAGMEGVKERGEERERVGGGRERTREREKFRGRTMGGVKALGVP